MSHRHQPLHGLAIHGSVNPNGNNGYGANGGLLFLNSNNGLGNSNWYISARECNNIFLDDCMASPHRRPAPAAFAQA